MTLLRGESTATHTAHINIFYSSLLFCWIAIPWLQTEIDDWVKFKNTTAPRAIKNKILPRGIPALIRSRPSHFNAVDFKVRLACSTCYSSLTHSYFIRYLFLLSFLMKSKLYTLRQTMRYLNWYPLLFMSAQITSMRQLDDRR